MITLWKTLTVTLALQILFSGFCAGATQPTSVTYLESDLGAGLWQYDFTVYNAACPAGDTCGDIFDVFLDIGVQPDLTFIDNLDRPQGWASAADPGNGLDKPGFLEVYSLIPGTPPTGADIAPGKALGGFVFQMDDKLNAIYFEVLSGNFDAQGQPIGDVFVTLGTATLVPLPASIVLLATALTALVIRRRKGNQ